MALEFLSFKGCKSLRKFPEGFGGFDLFEDIVHAGL
jgi:hypothetical protein